MESGKSRADGGVFITGLFGVIPSGFARAKSAPIPYDQLSGFHIGLVVKMVMRLRLGGRVARGQKAGTPVNESMQLFLFLIISVLLLLR